MDAFDSLPREEAYTLIEKIDDLALAMLCYFLDAAKEAGGNVENLTYTEINELVFDQVGCGLRLTKT